MYIVIIISSSHNWLICSWSSATCHPGYCQIVLKRYFYSANW